MKKKLDLALVGATGMVGEVFLSLLAERSFPVGRLRLLASSRSAGKKIRFGDRDLTVEELSPDSLRGSNLVFISATDEISKEYGELAKKQGSIAIDDSGVWRMDPKVPLVVPEINPADVVGHQGILAIPNCSTTPIVMVLWPLHQKNRVRRVLAATYQSVSGTGRSAVNELMTTSQSVLQGKDVSSEVYPHPIAFNLIPHIGSFREEDYTSEEWKMAKETRKIMHDDSIQFAATCVRVPVTVGHSAVVHVEFEHPLDPKEAREILSFAPGILVLDEPLKNIYPHPRFAAGKDPVFVGRIRRDMSVKNGIVFFVVCDNLRKGAALDAIQIAEELLARRLV